MTHTDSLWILPQLLNQTGPPPPATGTVPKTEPERPAESDSAPR